MKEFWTYTALRGLLFLIAFAVALGVWLAVDDSVKLLPVTAIAFVVSSAGSYFLLRGQRLAFSERVNQRATLAVHRHGEAQPGDAVR
ncbi:hypothetical protein ASE01_20305 [Nocardioides sp. Root190]|uniref:DUF4229 domain-containing protein n=1 Tax=Nocardioides sp. Root190 TaxID=1736488 RepID=UPI0006F98DE4|nr:DUF4229 domain-containing protein [Nocardioides sp. Root190]KRB73117.1 hypothetical protein ASE01_20305 [Nocardioides sp. Root190]